MKWHLRSRRTLTGKRLTRSRKKKKFERGSIFLETRIGKLNLKIKRTIGGNTKQKLMATEMVNLADPKTHKITPVKVLSVEKNPANPHYVRRNVMTKGAIVKTEAGFARITSSPGQCGTLSGVLIDEKK